MALRNITLTVSKNKIDKDKIREEKQKRLKELQEKFFKKNEELSKSIPKTQLKNNNANIISMKKTVTDKNLKEQLRNMNKKLEELREKDKKQKDIIFKLKNQVKTLNNELLNEKEKNSKLSDKTETYFSKINLLESEINKLNESYSKEKIQELEQSIIGRNIIIENKNFKIMELKNNIIKLNDKIKDYKEQIFNLKHGEEISIKDKKYYHKIITSYAQANSKLNQQLLELKQKYKEKVTSLVNSDVVLGQLKNDITVAKSIKGRKTNKSKRFGILKTINNFVFFESLEGELSPANIDRVEFKENIPCKAVIYYNRHNVALIQKVYNDNDIFIKELKESKDYKRKRERKKFAYENVDYENQYNVLIIGAENKEEYSSVLRKIGLNVVFYNSYEGNVVRLRNMLDRYDIIICCLRHSRHYATNLMTYMQEKDSTNVNKYNIIDKDNLENIIGRVRYCIENM